LGVDGVAESVELTGKPFARVLALLDNQELAG
jgi:hypothetical protein